MFAMGQWMQLLILSRGSSKVARKAKQRLEVPREQLPPALTHSENVFQLDHDIIAKTLKSARRGAQEGYSG